MAQKKKHPLLTHTLETRLGIFFGIATIAVVGSIYVHHTYFGAPPPPPPKPWAEFKREIWHGDTSKRQVIFTFDAGDGNSSGQKIIDVLARHGVKGTFFLTGKFIEKNPDLVRKMVAGGNEAFSHTYDHPHLPILTDTQIAAQLDRTEALMSSTTGTTTRPYFRAPFGDRDQRVLNDAFADGYRSVYWTVDARDWMEPNGETAQSVTDRIMSTLAPGNIYLMHVGDTITGDILDSVFTQIEAKGYKIVSLTQGI